MEKQRDQGGKQSKGERRGKSEPNAFVHSSSPSPSASGSNPELAEVDDEGLEGSDPTCEDETVEAEEWVRACRLRRERELVNLEESGRGSAKIRLRDSERRRDEQNFEKKEDSLEVGLNGELPSASGVSTDEGFLSSVGVGVDLNRSANENENEVGSRALFSLRQRKKRKGKYLQRTRSVEPLPTERTIVLRLLRRSARRTRGSSEDVSVASSSQHLSSALSS